MPSTRYDRDDTFRLLEDGGDGQPHVRLALVLEPPFGLRQDRQGVHMRAQLHHGCLDGRKDGRRIGALLDQGVPPRLAVVVAGNPREIGEGVAANGGDLRLRRLGWRSRFVSVRRGGVSAPLELAAVVSPSFSPGSCAAVSLRSARRFAAGRSMKRTGGRAPRPAQRLPLGREVANG